MNQTVKAALILVVVFAIGGLAGFVGSKRLDGRSGRPLGPTLDPFRMEHGMLDHIHGRLTNSYDLSDEQQLGVRKILEDAQEKYGALFRETRPTLEQIRRAQQMAIRESMTEAQKEQFDTWLEERRKRWEARGSRGDREGRGDRPRRDGNGGPGGH